MKFCKNDFDDYKTINIVEDETEWLVGDIYQYGDERRDGHYIYKYAGENDTNTILSPAVIYERDKEIFPIWVQIRPTNYYAMLDARTDSQTTNNADIIMTFDISNQNTFAMLNIQADNVNVSIFDTDQGIVTYNKDVETRDESSVIDFYSYCFSDFVFSDSIYLDDLPLTQNGILTITATAETVKIGRLVLGKSYFVGDTFFGATLGISSYSDKSIDTFGNVSLKQKGSVNIDTYKVQVPTPKVTELRKKAIEYDAVPILFIGDESMDTIVDNLLNFGYWTNFSILLPNPVKSTLSLSIKGLL